MADQSLNEEEKEVEESFEKWIDRWLAGEIDDSSFCILAVTAWFKKKWLAYQKYDELKPSFGIIIGCALSKDLQPKKKQQVKEKLQEIKRIWSDHECSRAEKEQDTAKVFDEIEGLLIGVISLLTE
jgi:hypothetical protein